MKYIILRLKIIVPLLTLFFLIMLGVFYKNFNDNRATTSQLANYYLPVSDKINQLLFEILSLEHSWSSTVRLDPDDIKLILTSTRIFSKAEQKISRIIFLVENNLHSNFPMALLLDVKQKIHKLSRILDNEKLRNRILLLETAKQIVHRLEQIASIMSSSLNQFNTENIKTEKTNLIINLVALFFVFIIYLPAMIITNNTIFKFLYQEKELKDQLTNAHKEIKRQAMFDSLTGLANRYLLYERITQILISRKRNNLACSILYIDLDNLKNINDASGHLAGDLLLKYAAKCLLSCVRESDTVARLGGDEFVVVLQNVDSKKAIEVIAEKMLSQINKPLTEQGMHLTTSFSIGIYIVEDVDVRNPENVDAILHKADSALYRAKNDGRNCYRFFKKTNSSAIMEKSNIE